MQLLKDVGTWTSPTSTIARASWGTGIAGVADVPEVSEVPMDYLVVEAPPHIDRSRDRHRAALPIELLTGDLLGDHLSVFSDSPQQR